MDYNTERRSICLERLNVVSPNGFFDLEERLKEKYGDKKVSIDLHRHVNNDVTIMRNTQNKAFDILKKEYIRLNGKKIRNDDEDYYYEDVDESEGRVLDHIYSLIKNIEKSQINPIGVCKTAILYKKKAEELNCVEDLRQMNYFGFTFNTGYYAEPYLGAILNGKILCELADNYEEYLEYHKKSDYTLDFITKWMGNNEQIQKWLKDEEINSITKLDTEQWTYAIALYYAENNKKIDNFTVFYPIDGNSEGPIKSFGYHIIYGSVYDSKLNKLIQNIDTTLSNKRESDKMLNKILKDFNENYSVDNSNILEYEQYLYIISTYFMKHTRSLKKDIIFHPNTSENDSYTFTLNYYDISYDNIKNMITHIKNIEKSHNFELTKTIKTWAINKNYITDISLSERAWIKIIKRHHKKNNIKMNKDILIYVPRKHEKDFCFDYRIIKYDDLIKEEEKFSMLDLIYDSESDTNVNSDSDEDIFN
tara:strand:- start:12236 stop:13666 length:1431 start_codon:yes stop_codon:yes gene_type:complete